MYIKEIEIKKSITIEMPGVAGQAKYQKFWVRLLAIYDKADYPLGVEGEYKAHYAAHLKRVKDALRNEINEIIKKK